jgi:P-type E1-E2 ATPase
MGSSLSCAHCGLPSRGERYCCYGCELAHRLLRDDEGERRRMAATLSLSLVLAMIVMMLSLFLYAEDVYGAASEPMFRWLRRAYAIIAGVLATPVVVLLGVPLGRRAVAALRGGRLSMDLLIVTGAAAAWVISWAAVLSGGASVYFDSATAALLLSTFGRYLEANARRRAGKLVGHLLEPVAAPVLAGAPGAPLALTAPAAIDAGMRVLIAPGAAVPVDLRAESAAEVELAVLTGEAAPVAVAAGDEVPAGAVVLSAPLMGVALRSARDSTLERLAEAARTLRDERGALARLADRLAAALTPLVALVALAALAYWGTEMSPGRGVEVALAVLLTACPCTYGAITPLIGWLTLKQALAHGVCIRHAGVLDALARVRTVAFDKTGTLTEPCASARVALACDARLAASLTAALEREVPHPFARPLAEWARALAAPADVTERHIGALGVSARDGGGEVVRLGAPAWVAGLGVAVPAAWREHSAVLARGSVALGAFAIEERTRPEARAAVAELAADGLRVAVLSGDRAARVDALARALGVAEREGDLSAADKVAALARLPAAAIVGDGHNDAPAASSLERGVADVVLLRADLRLVPFTLVLARRALALGWRTLAAATAYNLIFVSMAALGLLRPVWAGVSMLAASLIALVAALRMNATELERGHGWVATEAPIESAAEAAP